MICQKYHRCLKQFFVAVDANKREERTGGAVQASAEALGEAAGEMRQGEEQLSPGVQEREVRRQPGEERDERLEFVTGRGKIFKASACKYKY